jgi:hypothetical protein
MRKIPHHLTMTIKTVIQLFLLFFISLIGQTLEGQSQIFFTEGFKVEKELFSISESYV